MTIVRFSLNPNLELSKFEHETEHTSVERHSVKKSRHEALLLSHSCSVSKTLLIHPLMYTSRIFLQTVTHSRWSQNRSNNTSNDNNNTELQYNHIL